MDLTRKELVNADPATVWKTVVEVERWPEFMGHIDAVRRHDGEQLGMGSTATLSQPRLPDAVWTVDEFVPETSFRWSARLLGMDWSANHVVEPAQGGTSLTLSISVAGWPARLLKPFLERAAKHALAQEIAGFRAASEDRMQ